MCMCVAGEGRGWLGILCVCGGGGGLGDEEKP